MRKILQHFNFRREAKELGLPVWESPSFLFLIMGFLTIVVMIATYFSAKLYEDPALIVGAVSVVTIFIITIGTVIIRSVERIAESSRMKSEFISIASHELKTPLSAIKWALDLLLTYKKDEFNKEQLEYLIAVQENNERLIRLTSDLLDVSRIEGGVFVLNLGKCSIVQIIKESIDEFIPLARLANVSLSFSPPKEEIPLLHLDQVKIRVIVKNIINNSIKYIKGKGNVEITATRERKKVVIRVKDTGVGIPEYDQPLIFNKFYRSSNKLLYQTSGAGLGLFIAKAFVEASGGKIGFESEEKKGSTFWFTLPVR